MTSEAVSLFINPAAGRGKAGRHLARIESLLRHANTEVRTFQSRAVGDLEEQVCVQLQKGPRDIVIAGVDGSIHEAVNGILQTGVPARFGVIPVGTGNDFAKACGIPLDWELATTQLAARLAERVAGRRIDAGRMNDRYFANGAGIGFDAKVTKVARAYRWPIGDLVYLFAIFRCMIDGVATPEMSISTGELQWQGPITLASISNGPWVGGMFHIAPMAKNDDGSLDLVIADPVSRLRICGLIPRLIRGRHMTAPEITHARVQKLTIESLAPVPSHLDGEVQPMATVFDIQVLPGALTLL